MTRVKKSIILFYFFHLEVNLFAWTCCPECCLKNFKNRNTENNKEVTTLKKQNNCGRNKTSENDNKNHNDLIENEGFEIFKK